MRKVNAVDETLPSVEYRDTDPVLLAEVLSCLPTGSAS